MEGTGQAGGWSGWKRPVWKEKSSWDGNVDGRARRELSSGDQGTQVEDSEEPLWGKSCRGLQGWLPS